MGGGMTMYDDINNVEYDTVDKTKAVTVDAGQMAATIGVILGTAAVIAAVPVEIPALVVIGAGIVLGTGINWLAQSVKRELID